MSQYQHMIFVWVSTQPILTGLVILAGGLISAFHGLRMIRLLLFLYCVGLGAFVGHLATELSDLPTLLLEAAGAVVGLMLATMQPKLAGVVASGALWAGLLGYLGGQLGMRGYPFWIAIGLGGCMGTVFALLCRQTMMVLLTAIAGSALTIVGFVGVASVILPSVAKTFRTWADSVPLMIIILLGMLSVAAYSLQSRDQRGEICTGSQKAASGV